MQYFRIVNLWKETRKNVYLHTHAFITSLHMKENKSDPTQVTHRIDTNSFPLLKFQFNPAYVHISINIQPIYICITWTENQIAFTFFHPVIFIVTLETESSLTDHTPLFHYILQAKPTKSANPCGTKHVEETWKSRVSQPNQLLHSRHLVPVLGSRWGRFFAKFSREQHEHCCKLCLNQTAVSVCVRVYVHEVAVWPANVQILHSSQFGRVATAYACIT